MIIAIVMSVVWEKTKMSDDHKHKEIMDTLKDISDKMKNHEDLDNKRFANVVTKPTEREIKEQQLALEISVENAMKKAISDSGKWSYRALIVVAVIFASITTILVGFKTILGWIGFGLIKK